MWYPGRDSDPHLRMRKKGALSVELPGLAPTHYQFPSKSVNRKPARFPKPIKFVEIRPGRPLSGPDLCLCERCAGRAALGLLFKRKLVPVRRVHADDAALVMVVENGVVA